MIRTITVDTPGKGLHEITRHLAPLLRDAPADDGLCTVFLRHTSASLIIQENADPSAKHDLEAWLDRLVPPNDPLYTHNDEGPDDMPAHIKAALTAAAIAIPFENRRLALGTWQGLYLWEHRTRPHTRSITVHLGA